MTTVAPPGDLRILLSGIVGSKAYGIDRPDSDTDRLGIFVAPTVEFLGLTRPVETYNTADPDITLHEVGKFVRLALACNPTVLELMWLPLGLYEKIDPMAYMLTGRGLRGAFLSAKKVRDSYLGYAREQFYRMVRRDTVDAGRPERVKKNARHVYRLLQQGYELYTTGQLTLRVGNPQELFAFADCAAVDPDSALDMIWDYEVKFDRATTPLPEKPDVARVEKWLVGIRKDFL